MAQIGVVCFGFFLLKDEISSEKKPQIALTSNQVDFFVPVLPNEKVTVVSEKEYFRFNKLKCKVKMINEKNELVCRGSISGMIIPFS
jgi:3-hydroxyacyl-[acyl-carrier-protein] dehydratase